MSAMKKKPVSERLREVLAELASMPVTEAKEAIGDAVSEAYVDVGCGESRPMLARLCIEMAAGAARVCQYDMEELSDFYLKESKFDGSDHTPSDCRDWMHEYLIAGNIMEKTADDLDRLGELMDKDSKYLDI